MAHAPGSSPSGHVMTVVSKGPLQSRSNSTQSFLKNNGESEEAYFIDVTVIDSTQYPHGAGDTRAPNKTGIGQGVVRLLMTSAYNYCGYTWSTADGEAFNSQAATQRDALFGRWIPQAFSFRQNRSAGQRGLLN